MTLTIQPIIQGHTLPEEKAMQQEIKCVNCAHFRPLAQHEDTVSLPDELNRGLCVQAKDMWAVFFGDMTCENAVPAYQEHARSEAPSVHRM